MYMINHSLNKNIIPIGDGVIVSDLADAPTKNGWIRMSCSLFSPLLSSSLSPMLSVIRVFFGQDSR
jgi:hypothetical protein